MLNYFFGAEFHVSRSIISLAPNFAFYTQLFLLAHNFTFLRAIISLAPNFMFYAQLFLRHPISRKLERLFWSLTLRHRWTWSS